MCFTSLEAIFKHKGTELQIQVVKFILFYPEALTSPRSFHVQILSDLTHCILFCNRSLS